MQIIVDVKDKEIEEKIIRLLKIFEDDGIRIQQRSEDSIREVHYDDEVKSNKGMFPAWQKELMTSEKPSIDDDIVLPQAYVEYNSEKYTD